ncbi:MAG TPA: hypothetical protein PKW08_11645 [Flavobacteriaceae bacterium]|nr:hypothetical protein [Flavobacteriaceae bacterium]MCB9213218.1 hypothetical protein [Alteromonas sp.]HPF10110.1 hypothetical protein [Flavobacteriaceae bacterium]HQU22231.1 hypothetical protein [Flavobacteriaceae bacterium]HQU66112.1 hypothetical protein [Flavobacteriaceae bacterium]
MEALNEFVNQLPELSGVFLLMLSTFLIGYLSAHYLQKVKYSKLLKKVKRQATSAVNNAKIADIETIFTEIKPKIIEVVKETQSNKQEIATSFKSPQEIAETARTSYLTYTKSKPELNFDNFGYASQDEKDDLTKINGIGPYIEQRLNEIGIYNYDQISRFTDEDIRVLTELIDFFPGRIERDSWIAQAQSLKHY